MRKFLAKILGITHKHVEIPEEMLHVHKIDLVNPKPIRIVSQHSFDLELISQLGPTNVKAIMKDLEHEAAQRIYEELLKGRLIKTTTEVDEFKREQVWKFEIHVIEPKDVKNRG